MDDNVASKGLACTLTTHAHRLEIKRFRDEIMPHLLNREIIKNGSLLTFSSTPELLIKIEKLAKLDKNCCSFLSHNVQTIDKNILWTVESEGEGIVLAQNYLSVLISKKNKPLVSGSKIAAVLTVCGIACSAPLVLGVMGLGLAGFGLGAFGIEIAVVAVAAIAAGLYWFYNKMRIQNTKGKKNENRCGC